MSTRAWKWVDDKTKYFAICFEEKVKDTRTTKLEHKQEIIVDKWNDKMWSISEKVESWTEVLRIMVVEMHKQYNSVKRQKKFLIAKQVN